MKKFLISIATILLIGSISFANKSSHSCNRSGQSKVTELANGYKNIIEISTVNSQTKELTISGVEIAPANYTLWETVNSIKE